MKKMKIKNPLKLVRSLSLVVIGIAVIPLVILTSVNNAKKDLYAIETDQLKEVYYSVQNAKGSETIQATESESMYKYLSDIEYDKTQSKVEWGSITPDSNLETQHNYGLITLIIHNEEDNSNEKTYFLKGMSAHATSTLVYDISDYDYDYFSTYVGVDASRENNGNGVKFKIYTSTNGTTWDLKTDLGNKVFKGNTPADLVTIKLDEGVTHLKLEANNNGNNASDHSVYANAKLYKEGYTEVEAKPVEFIKTVEEYDRMLAGKDLINNLSVEDEKTLLQRTFVNNVGYKLLQAIVNQDKDYEDAVKWMMDDIENLRLYVLGGAPDGGSYYNSIKELSRLYKAHAEDFENTTQTNNPWCQGLTKGQVYKKMAISLSLTHATKVGYWAQIDHPSNRSESVKRYEIYKKLYDEGKFVVAREVETNDDGTVTPKMPITPIKNADGTSRQDHTPWFEALTVEEMRYVMNNITDDEELIWFNDYTQKRIDANPGQEEKYLQPHTYIAYVTPNFENPIFHDPTKKEEWNTLFEGIFDPPYNVTYSEGNDHVYKAWMSMRNKYGTGAVCGGIAKLGCHIRAAHGTPATVVGQPGHAALIYYRKDAQGRGYWTLDNDVSGWAQSGKSEKMGTRMPLGWGSDSYVNGYAATYMMLSQEAMNDNANYEKSEKIIMTVDLHKDDLAEQEKIYREALKVQKINIDAWWGLINTYRANENKTEEDYFELAKDLGEALKAFPLPMKNLLDQIKPVFDLNKTNSDPKKVEYTFKFTLLETELLTEGTTYGLTAEGKEDTSKKLDVMQPSITRTVAKYLLGQTDTTLATFSFDGADARKIVLSNKFDGNGVRWEYSLDKGKSWQEVDFEADQSHKWELKNQEIAKITAENDIWINIVGVPRADATIYKIDIKEQEPLKNVYANDLENRLIGVDLNTEWRMSKTLAGSDFGEWTSYENQSPDLTGEKYIQLRQKATGTFLASSVSEIYGFTPNNEREDRKYISVSDMKIYSQNTQSKDPSRPHYAENIIDANDNTIWNTDFAIDLTKEGAVQPEIIIELNKPKYISALEFIEKKYTPKNRDGIKSLTVSVSNDEGEEKTWTEVGKIDGLTNATYGELRKIEFAEHKLAKYIKLDMTTYDYFAAISTVNIYEDTTKIDKSIPTASIYYSTTEPTSEYVIARLTNPSTEITITNNDGNDTYVFKENGSFTFQFEDKNGNKGQETATVNWIDRSSPEANVEYGLDGDQKLSILLNSISENVYLLDENDNKISYIEVNKDKKVSKISYIDESGEIYKVVELDNDGNIIKTTYRNTTGQVPNVKSYVAPYTNGKLNEDEEAFLDENGSPVTVTADEKEIFRRLDKIKTNPLEYTFEKSGNYEFKLLDAASNIAYKSIKADYLEDNNIIASDISYDIANITNKDVVATINPYMINPNIRDEETNALKKLPVAIIKGESTDKVKVSDENSSSVTFEDNTKFTFKYKDASDKDDSDIKEHTAQVHWIDKTAPTAKIRYSVEQNEKTTDPVTVELVDESETIVVTNNNMNREYTFTKNDEFTFEFMDAAGNKGTAKAIVNNIELKPDDAVILGDANNDGKLTSTDLMTVKRHLVAGNKQEWILTEEQIKLADINKDNKVTATDLILLKRLILEQMKTQ